MGHSNRVFQPDASKADPSARASTATAIATTTAALTPALTKEGRLYQKLGLDLLQLGMAAQAFSPAMLRRQGVGTQSSAFSRFSSNTNLLQIQDGFVVLDAVAVSRKTAQQLRADLEELGLKQASTWERMVSGLFPIVELEHLVRLDALKFARPTYRPITHVGSVTSQADASLNSELTRAKFGVDGTGVTVGVLSDSFDALGGAADDIGSGDLPGPGNLLGRTTPVNVLLDDDDAFNIDEGRGMLQLIHDLAPGADLAFHTASFGEASFANGILSLAEDAKADVIVDDILYLAEPMFQDGIVAQAVDQVVKSGVAYFSSAGNDGRSAYQQTFTPSGLVEDLFGGELHDFDPGPGVDVFQEITIPVGAEITIAFQWDSPFFSVSGGDGSLNDLDIFLYDATGTTVLTGSAIANTGDDPVEIFSFFNDGSTGTATEFNLAISAFDGPMAGLMRYVVFGPDDVTINEYDTASGSLYGHANAAGAAAVGAAFYSDTPAFGQDPAVIQPFSSAGTTPILFNQRGDRLLQPILRQKPDIVAVDGANTSFFPSFPDADVEGDGFPNFFGTSAAAPHAAAVAALMIEAAEVGVTPELIYKTLKQTALDMDDPFTPEFDEGFDEGTGFGLIQADRAVQAMLRPVVMREANDTLATAIALNPVPAGEPLLVVGSIGDNAAVDGPDDVDLLGIQLNGGDRLRLDVDANTFDGTLDPLLRFFDSAGNQLAISDDDPAPGEPLSLDPYLDITVGAAGTYYIGLSSFNNSSYDPEILGSGSGLSSGDYTLTVELN